MTSVHGDDFTTAGPKKSLDWFKKSLEEHYELKEAARLGPGSSDDKEVRVLNRIASWGEQGLTYEADPRQYEKLVNELSLNGAKAVTTPCVRHTIEEVNKDLALEATRITHFRGLSARANYLSADRPDCQYAAKEVCRWTASPTELGVQDVKRLAR